jgi:uncharacterized protein YqhQ
VRGSSVRSLGRRARLLLRDAVVRSSRLLLLEEDVLLGGQAVLEGVMMRSPRSMAVAVRRPDGEISIYRRKVAALGDLHPILRVPVIRGAAVMIQAMLLGFQSLNYSAEAALGEAPASAPAGEGDGARGQAPPQDAAAPPAGKSSTGGTIAIVGSLAIALCFGFGLFFLLPLGLTQLLRTQWPALQNGLAFNLADGVIRISVFLAYIFGISLMRDIRRVFEYHGAEHKTVHAHEKGRGLSVETVRACSRLHPRCGTSFLLFVMVASILVFSFLPSNLPFYVLILPRLALVPLIAGISYEAIRASARHIDSTISRILIRPGLWLQKLTTREPSDDQIVVAVRALEAALSAAPDAEIVPA